jgi:hypothetical protein
MLGQSHSDRPRELVGEGKSFLVLEVSTSKAAWQVEILTRVGRLVLGQEVERVVLVLVVSDVTITTRQLAASI